MKLFLWIIFVMYLIFVFTFDTVMEYYVDRDIDSLLDHAQVAADREDMLGYMKQLKSNMERINMTHGYTAFVFRTPRNNILFQYEGVKKIVKRLESIKTIKKSETVYQVALDDLRGTIREFPRLTRGWLWVKYELWLVLTGIGLLAICLLVTFLVKRY